MKQKLVSEKDFKKPVATLKKGEKSHINKGIDEKKDLQQITLKFTVSFGKNVEEGLLQNSRGIVQNLGKLSTIIWLFISLSDKDSTTSLDFLLKR